MSVIGVLSRVPNLIRELKYVLPNLAFQEISLPGMQMQYTYT